MKHPIKRFADGQVDRADDELAIEEPLEIRVRGRAISVTMRTPGQDEELATGFLLTEGIIGSRDDILAVEPCDRSEAGNLVNVILAPHVAVDFNKLTRHVFASSSCGVCGKATIESIHAQFAPIDTSIAIDAKTLLQLPATMRLAQPNFERTGGLHAAALFDSKGKLIVAREDVGRHNAVDKIVGRTLLDRMFPLEQHVLLVSGRASFEIMQKALAARIPIVAAVSAPSSLAVDFARDSNQTLVGFLRGERFNIYAHEQRITS